MIPFVSILGFLTGLAGPLSQLANNITDLKKQKLIVESDKERQLINQQIEEAQVRKAMYIADAGSRVGSFFNGIMRFAMASCALAIIAKLMVWDKVVGSFYGCTGDSAARKIDCITFRTDPLDVYQWSIIGGVAAFYFGYDMFAKSRK